jgi:hypothetical protein
MSGKLIALSLCLLSAACAGWTSHKQPLESARPVVLVDDQEMMAARSSPNLFVGHSEEGKLVMAANHYAAMGGLAVEASDLGLPALSNGSTAMLCERQVLTGSHLPRWICRYKDEADEDRAQVLQALQVPRLDYGRTGSRITGVSTGVGGGAKQR